MLTYRDYQMFHSKNAMKEALLSDRVDDNISRCGICQWRCKIARGRAGACGTIVNYEGKLYTIIYGVVSSAAVDPIEKKPVFHFKPGSLCYSVGSLGCNFRCIHCQNWQISYDASVTRDVVACETNVTAEKLVKTAKVNACEGVAWTYNEPSIWLNYTLDCARLCKEKGLYTVYVTNGYATPEGLDMIGPYLDVYRVDIKSMQDDYYRKLVKIPQWREILDVAVRAKHKWKMHVECVTNIVPGWNDSDENLSMTAKWIAEELGVETPWHVTRFFPYGELSNIPPTPSETLFRAVEIGKSFGLKFVYLGNMQSETGENTYCPKCGNLAVERSGYRTRMIGINKEGRCSVDNEYLNIRFQ